MCGVMSAGQGWALLSPGLGSDNQLVEADTLLANKCWRDNTQLVVLETKLESGLVKSVQEYLDYVSPITGVPM